MKRPARLRAGPMARRAALALAAAAALAAGCGKLHYPQAPRSDVVDDYHGTRIADPYRPLEALDAPATRAWVSAENRITRPWLAAIAQRAPIKKRLAQLWHYERFGVPQKQGGRYFYLHNDGTQNQSVLYVAQALEDPGRVLFDPNSAPTGSPTPAATGRAGTSSAWRTARICPIGWCAPNTGR